MARKRNREGTGKVETSYTLTDANGLEHDLEIEAQVTNEEPSDSGPGCFEVEVLKVTEEIEGVTVNVTDTIGDTYREELADAVADSLPSYSNNPYDDDPVYDRLEDLD